MKHRPEPPESRFVVEGVNLWPFDRRRREGPWSERDCADVYGATPAWVRRAQRNSRPCKLRLLAALLLFLAAEAPGGTPAPSPMETNP